ncbi:MAG: alpha/beta hydrolase [Spirochaetota bacterium]
MATTQMLTTNHPIILLDMPMHADSMQVDENWTLYDCADMLVEIIQNLGLQKVIAVGHSWGSMTIMRAFIKSPEYFEKVILFNMPTRSLSKTDLRRWKINHIFLGMRGFYMSQVAKTFYYKENYKINPELKKYLYGVMGPMDKRTITKTDAEVIMSVQDSYHMLGKITVPAFFIIGRHDYVRIPENYPSYISESAHLTPMEDPGRSNYYLREIVGK